jgi:hypothetical protein
MILDAALVGMHVYVKDCYIYPFRYRISPDYQNVYSCSYPSRLIQKPSVLGLYSSRYRGCASEPLPNQISAMFLITKVKKRKDRKDSSLLVNPAWNSLWDIPHPVRIVSNCRPDIFRHLVLVKSFVPELIYPIVIVKLRKHIYNAFDILGIAIYDEINNSGSFQKGRRLLPQVIMVSPSTHLQNLPSFNFSTSTSQHLNSGQRLLHRVVSTSVYKFYHPVCRCISPFLHSSTQDSVSCTVSEGYTYRVLTLHPCHVMLHRLGGRSKEQGRRLFWCGEQSMDIGWLVMRQNGMDIPFSLFTMS